MDTWQWVGLVVLVVSFIGAIVRCIIFGLDPMSTHGFGALEVSIVPWVLAASIGLGLYLQSTGLPAALFLVSLFGLGPLVRSVSSLFKKE